MPQGGPVAWQARCVWPNGRKSTEWSLVTATNAELTPKMRAEYLARLTHPDGSPSYEVRALYAATPAPAPPATDAGAVGDAFEQAFNLIFETYSKPADNFNDDEQWAIWQHGKVTKAFTLLQQVRAARAKGQS